MTPHLLKELVRGLLLVVFSPVLIIWAIFDGHGRSMESWSFRVVNSGVEIGNSVREIWCFFVGVVKLAGWITIVILVASSVTTLLYLVLHEAGISWAMMESYYLTAERLLQSKVAWAAISIVLGAMVAISHLKNLEINEMKFDQEQTDRARRKREFDEERRNKRHSGNA